ncbi:hypothetical protein DRN77_06270 [Methanosarcinales archaeon]|nr:MAG: hypothetical protein DRN77_06270 [Methanosarcinales archaeon]
MYAPKYLGRNSVRSDEGTGGRGIGKKRMTACNESYRGSEFALTRKGADLTGRCFVVCAAANL